MLNPAGRRPVSPIDGSRTRLEKEMRKDHKEIGGGAEERACCGYRNKTKNADYEGGLIEASADTACVHGQGKKRRLLAAEAAVAQ